jgi:predicted transcriptional regulator
VKKSVTIHFRLTQAEKTALERIARQDLRTPSAMIRELIRSEARARGLRLARLAEPSAQT